MNSFAQAVLSNAVVASVFAGILGVVGHRLRNPSLRHALWFLVLIKLVTPPVWNIPIDPGFAGMARPAREPLEVVETVVTPAVLGNSDPSPLTPAPVVPDATIASEAFVDPVEASTSAPVPEASRDPNVIRHPMRVLGWGWAVGALGLFGITLARVLRFGRVLAQAPAAGESIQIHARRIARRLGIDSPPRVVQLDGIVPPLLWPGWGRSVIGLPAALISRMSWGEMETLLTHELAHFRRRDHWVRWVETLIVGLYWWHPVAWWARRQMRRAEEDACDAWVLWALPGSAKRYANALLTTLEFLSPNPKALPSTACGFDKPNQLREVKARFEMILKQAFLHRMTPRQVGLVVLVAAIVLPGSGQLWRSHAAEGERVLAEEAALALNAPNPPPVVDTQPYYAALPATGLPVGNMPVLAPDNEALSHRLDRIEAMVERMSSRGNAAPKFVDDLEQELERARRQVAVARSAAEAGVARADMELDLAKVVLGQKRQIQDKSPASELELLEAQHRVRLAELARQHAELERDSQIRDLEAQVQLLQARREKLSAAVAAPSGMAGEVVVLTLRADEPQYQLGADPVEIDELGRRLTRLARQRTPPVLSIVAESTLPFGDVFKVFEMARTSGLQVEIAPLTGDTASRKGAAAGTARYGEGSAGGQAVPFQMSPELMKRYGLQPPK